MDLRHAGGFLHLRVGRVRAAIADVVADRVVEQHRVLRDDADGPAHACLFDIPHVLSVDQHPAFRHVIEAVKQPGDGGLARTGRPDNRHHAAGGHGEADVLQDRARGIIGEEHVLEPHFAAIDLERHRTRLVLHLGANAQQREHGFHVHQCLLDLAVDEAEQVKGLVQLDEHGVDQHEVA